LLCSPRVLSTVEVLSIEGASDEARPTEEHAPDVSPADGNGRRTRAHFGRIPWRHCGLLQRHVETDGSAEGGAAGFEIRRPLPAIRQALQQLPVLQRTWTG